jgi:hypothetical protein
VGLLFFLFSFRDAEETEIWLGASMKVGQKTLKVELPGDRVSASAPVRTNRIDNVGTSILDWRKWI